MKSAEAKAGRRGRAKPTSTISTKARAILDRMRATRALEAKLGRLPTSAEQAMLVKL